MIGAVRRPAAGAIALGAALSLQACGPNYTPETAPPDAGQLRRFDAPYPRVCSVAADAVVAESLDIVKSAPSGDTALVIIARKPGSALSTAQWVRVTVARMESSRTAVRIYTQRANLSVGSAGEHDFANPLYAAIEQRLKMQPPRLTIDHVILGSAQLDSGVAEFARATGVQPMFGGRHPGRGTQNALVSLGGLTYLEIMAPSRIEGEPAAVFLYPFDRPTPIGWAVTTTDIDATVAGLRARGYDLADPVPGSRVTPAGDTLRWRTAAILRPTIEVAPFFIEWGSDTRHPSTTTPDGCRLTSMLIEDPDAETLGDMLEGLDPRAVIAKGQVSAIRLDLECPRGAVQFGR